MTIKQQKNFNHVVRVVSKSRDTVLGLDRCQASQCSIVHKNFIKTLIILLVDLIFLFYF